MDEWDRSVPDVDKDSCPDTAAVILKIHEYVSEKVIFGKRIGKNEHWVGEINLYPGDTRVAKLRTGPQDPSFYGVCVGMIEDFWEFSAGAHVFYGRDKKMYCHPGSRWGVIEGEWEVFQMEGGWDMRGLSSDRELDDDEFETRPVTRVEE
jgi:hypothetical protein